jgi:hypothetical protein
MVKSSGVLRKALPTYDMYRQVSELHDLQLRVDFFLIFSHCRGGLDFVLKRINQEYLSPIEPLPDR